MLTRPARPSVFLKNLNKQIFLNFITVSDEEWIQEQYPNDQIIEDIKEGKPESMLDLFWHLLDNDAKRLIKDAKIVKWNGFSELEVPFDSPVEKLKHIISGADEVTAIINAVFRSNELSQPDKMESQKKSPKAVNR